MKKKQKQFKKVREKQVKTNTCLESLNLKLPENVDSVPFNKDKTSILNF